MSEMGIKDISTIRRFLGFVEGIAVSMPGDTQTILYDYIEMVDEILNQEEKEHES